MMKRNRNQNILCALASTGLVLAVASTAVRADSSGLTVSNLKPTAVTVNDNASDLIKRVITLIIVVGALLALYYLIMGAIAWITSDGDPSKVETARNKMLYAVVGLLVLASVWAIFQLVLTLAFGKADISMPKLVGS